MIENGIIQRGIVVNTVENLCQTKSGSVRIVCRDCYYPPELGGDFIIKENNDMCVKWTLEEDDIIKNPCLIKYKAGTSKPLVFRSKEQAEQFMELIPFNKNLYVEAVNPIIFDNGYFYVCGFTEDKDPIKDIKAKEKDIQKINNIFISQPMSGHTIEEIKAKRLEYLYKIRIDLEGADFHLLDNLQEDAHYDHPLFYLSNDLKLLAETDIIYFAHDWVNAKGCMVEHQIAKLYNIEIRYL